MMLAGTAEESSGDVSMKFGGRFRVLSGLTRSHTPSEFAETEKGNVEQKRPAAGGRVMIPTSMKLERVNSE